jgi:hypothetical protein
MLLVPQALIVVAAVPLNVTVPWVEPKFDPAIWIDEPTGPLLGDRLVMLGAAVTVKLTPLLETPPGTVTTTLPVVAPVGTTAVMLLVVQALIVVAAVPLNFTVPWVEPKFDPAIWIDEPTGPLLGVRLLMLGVAPPPPGLIVTAASRKLLDPKKATVSDVLAASVVILYSLQSPLPSFPPWV